MHCHSRGLRAGIQTLNIIKVVPGSPIKDFGDDKDNLCSQKLHKLFTLFS